MRERGFGFLIKNKISSWSSLNMLYFVTMHMAAVAKRKKILKRVIFSPFHKLFIILKLVRVRGRFSHTVETCFGRMLGFKPVTQAKHWATTIPKSRGKIMKDDKIQKPPSVTLLFVITKKYILLLTDDVAHKYFRSISF